jgi:hypothetical protein
VFVVVDMVVDDDTVLVVAVVAVDIGCFVVLGEEVAGVEVVVAAAFAVMDRIDDNEAVVQVVVAFAAVGSAYLMALEEEEEEEGFLDCCIDVEALTLVDLGLASSSS